MKNLFKPATLFVFVAGLMLVSCSSEAPDHSLSTQPTPSGPGQTVVLSLSVATPSVDEVSYTELDDVDPTPKARSWDDRAGFPFKIVDADRTHVRPAEGDTGGGSNVKAKLPKVDKDVLLQENPERDILIMIRKGESEAQEFAYAQRRWRYNEQIGAYEIKKEDITLPASWGTLSATDKLYARVVTGARYNEAKKTLEVDEHLSELDLTRATAMKASVPFVSDWVLLDLEEKSGRIYIAQKTPHQDGSLHNNRMHLKPLGSLLLLSFRNTGDEDLTFSTVRILSNAQVFSGEYDLTKNELVCTPPDTKIPRSYDIYDIAETRDRFREKVLTLNTPLELKHQSNPRTFNSRVLVLWTAPVAGKKTITGNLSNTVSAAQTMIFSNDPRGASNQIIKYPNYTIEPIMGTNRLLESGKTYAMNCEFYTGRKPILGYYAQYTVNANGDGFDTSHENSKVSLVHYTKARDFLAGKELTRPGSSEKNTYFVGMRGSASLLNLLYGIPFDGSDGYTTDPGAGLTEYRGRNAIFFPDFSVKAVNGSLVYTFQENPRSWLYVMYSKRKSPRDGIAYYLVGRRDAQLARPSRSNSQALYRVEAMGIGAGKNQIEQMRIKSFSTGKYFVGGTYTPIYRGMNAMDERLWTDPTVLQGGYAERYIPAPGGYAQITASDYNRTTPAQVTRKHVGLYTYYWFNTGSASNYLLSWYKRGSNASVRPSSLTETFTFDQTFIDAFNQERIAVATTAKNNLDRQGMSLIGYGRVDRPLNGAVAATLPTKNTNPLLVGADGRNYGHASDMGDMASFLWLALLPYSTTYQGDEPVVPSHEH